MVKRNLVKPYPGMIIRESVSFYPGVYNFFGKEGIIIQGDHITIEGNGSVLIGGKPKATTDKKQEQEDFSYGYRTMKETGLGYMGTGFYMKDSTYVTLQGVTVKGFERGLFLKNSCHCKIQQCDFSYNYHNPDWGWDEHEDLGGMILEDSHENEIIDNRAENVWSALVLRNSSRNRIKKNCCAHTSNVGLRLWGACDNKIEDNDFSWGIRKNPEEVHARDSSCVLIESGSCGNVFRKNDMRYGGDGLFIRSLNNQMSMNNLFEENDASFANNNAIEAWDAGNTYIRNKANYSSYGFWLGCSDHTVLIENEVKGNGTIFQNAPESFGNAGIAVVNGSGHDFYLEKNRIMENNGPGIAIRHKSGDPSRNWILKENEIIGNKNDSRGYCGHGIYIKHAVNIHLLNNRIEENEGQAVFEDTDVSEVYRYDDKMQYHREELCGLESIMEPEQTVMLKMKHNYENYKYVSDHGDVYRQEKPEIQMQEPGRYRWYADGWTQNLLGTAVSTCYVLPKGDSLLEEKQVIWQKKEKHAEAQWDITPCKIGDKNCLCMLYRYENDFIDWEKEVHNPTVVLMDENGKSMEIQPLTAVFSEACQKANEAKYEMEFLYLPLQEQEGFTVHRQEGFNGHLVSMKVKLDTPIESTGSLQIFAARLCLRDWKEYRRVCRPEELKTEEKETCIQFSENPEYRILIPQKFQYQNSIKWITGTEEIRSWIRLNLSDKMPIDKIRICFCVEKETSGLPKNVKILDENGRILAEKNKICSTELVFNHMDAAARSITIEFEKQKGSSIEVRQLLIYKRDIDAAKIYTTASHKTVFLQNAEVKLNAEKSSIGEPLPGLIYRWYKSCPKSLKDSELLFEGELSSEQIQPGSLTKLPFPELKLEKGMIYHLMLFPQKNAHSITEGAYYRWVGDGIAPMDGSYGYQTQEGFISEGKTGWGKNYLRLHLNNQILDFSTDNEGMGNRFGIPGMERIFQMVQIPDEQEEVMNPNYLQNSTGIRVEGKREIEIICEREDETVDLWMEEDDYSVMDTELEWERKGQRLSVSGLSAGSNRLTIKSDKNRILCMLSCGGKQNVSEK